MSLPCRRAYGNALAERLMQAGAALRHHPLWHRGVGRHADRERPSGGRELNGQTTAHDLGMGKLLSEKKDFIGRAMAARPALTDPARPTLIGLKPIDGTTHLARRQPSAAARCGADARQRPGLCHLRCLSRRRSAIRSRWLCWPTARRASARPSASMIRCAMATRWPKWYRRCFTMPDGSRLHA